MHLRNMSEPIFTEQYPSEWFVNTALQSSFMYFVPLQVPGLNGLKSAALPLGPFWLLNVQTEPYNLCFHQNTKSEPA